MSVAIPMCQLVSYMHACFATCWELRCDFDRNNCSCDVDRGLGLCEFFLSLMPALMKDGFPINFNIWIKVLQKDCVTV